MALWLTCVNRSIRSSRCLLLCTRFARVFSGFQKYYSSFCSIKHILSNHKNKSDQVICIKGWVKSVQKHKDVTFLHVNDGSGPQNIQIVIPQPLAETSHVMFGSCVEIQGILQESPAKGQDVELLCTSVNILGPCNPQEYPLKQRTRHPPQYTRDFLHKNDFMFVHTPILTSSDCEGACEVFKVEPLKNDTSITHSYESDEDKIGKGPQLDRINDVTTSANSGHFFSQPAFLTVSGQLHLEVMTGAFSKVYNFGPVFRVEGSYGSFHLSEFYMVEAEMAFLDKLEDLLNVMEQLVKYVCNSVLNECPEDVSIFLKYVSPSKHMPNLYRMLESTFEKLSYAEAIHILSNSKEDFQFKASWGCDLKKEHELHLTKAVGNIPVFVTDYPAEIKPFYARRNDDSLTVAASDLLMPGIGELCGSSLREERADVLENVMTRKGLLDQMLWYLELRKFGTCPHGGFGLGFERLLMALLGVGSLKDVIPFPRWSGNCKT